MSVAHSEMKTAPEMYHMLIDFPSADAHKPKMDQGEGDGKKKAAVAGKKRAREDGKKKAVVARKKRAKEEAPDEGKPLFYHVRPRQMRVVRDPIEVEF